jgi:hypothetical protein
LKIFKLCHRKEHNVYLFFGFVFSFGTTGVWTQGYEYAKQLLYPLSHTSSPFCPGYSGDSVLWTICPCWPQTLILPISASQVARITGVGHWCLTNVYF